MRFSPVLAGTCLFAVLASGAVAQTADPSPSPAALEHAHHLMQSMHIPAMTDQIMGAIEKSMLASMSNTVPADQKQTMSAFSESLNAELRDYMPTMINSMERIYATNFTDEELTKMDEFYSSPVGQSILTKIPKMTQQLLPQVMAQMPDMMGRVFKRYCDKTTCTPAMHEAINKAVDKMKAGRAS